MVIKNPRVIAAKTLAEIIGNKKSLTPTLEKHLPKAISDHALIKVLCFGALRFYFQIIAIIEKLVEKPLKTKDIDIQMLLLLGLYQIIHMRIPEHAAVSETVNAARELKKPWATKLLNACLRKFLREQAALLAELEEIPSAHYAHPNWLITQIQNAWPNQWQAILGANNQQPPLCLRINQQKISRSEYLKILLQHEIAANPAPFTKNGLVIQSPRNITDLPGFHEGFFSVQDSAAQLSAELLELKPGQRILDACAAPGGKTAHILETESLIAELVAIDLDEKRLSKISDNLSRLGLHAKLIAADAAIVATWWDGNLFDRILLDAPCSSTGVIRRHPDIKVLRQPNDIQQYAQQQIHLLKSLWPLLKPGGFLLYATCSIMPEENTYIINRFLSETKDAKEKIISAGWGTKQSVGRQILPETMGMDGFYYACINKL